ncbi:MAG: hypothetical protein ACFFDF_11965 [Candidatus Odinarchaeota archaeon]
MSLGKLQKYYKRELQEEIHNGHLVISKIVIPFSRLFKKYDSADIYSGTEKIPFKERDPEFRNILQQEFYSI